MQYCNSADGSNLTDYGSDSLTTVSNSDSSLTTGSEGGSRHTDAGNECGSSLTAESGLTDGYCSDSYLTDCRCRLIAGVAGGTCCTTETTSGRIYSNHFFNTADFSTGNLNVRTDEICNNELCQ